MMRPRRPAVWYRFAPLLILWALAMRVAVPSGFMLASGGGIPKLMLCDGMSPTMGGMPMAAMAMPHHGGHDHPGDQPSSDRPCAFSAAAFAADVATPTVVAPPTLEIVPLATPRMQQAQPGRGLAAPPPWQTGPPAFA